MVTLTVSARGKPPAVAKALPISVSLPGQDVTVGDAKRSIAKQFPKVNILDLPPYPMIDITV
jgi:hypothetical protein